MHGAVKKINFEKMLNAIDAPVVLLAINGDEASRAMPVVSYANDAAGSLRLPSRNGNAEILFSDVLPALIHSIPGLEKIMSEVISDRKTVVKKIFLKSSGAVVVLSFRHFDPDSVMLLVSTPAPDVEMNSSFDADDDCKKYSEAGERFLPALLDAVPFPVFFKDREERFVECNDLFAESMLGLPREEVVGKTMFDLHGQLPEDFVANVHERDVEFLARPGKEQYQQRLPCFDGKFHDFEVSKASYENDEGRIAGIVGVLINLSDERLAHKFLVETYEEIEGILSSIDSILIGVSTRDTIAHWNKRAEEVFNIKTEDALGKSINNLGIIWDWERVFEGISESILQRKAVVLDDIVFRNHEGLERFIGMRVNPIIDRKDALRGFLLYGNDVTDKRILEMQMLQDQKLKSIGELAAGIAHEINTPTQYINDNLHFLQKGFAGIMELCARVKILMEDTLSCEDNASLIEELRNIAQKMDLGFLYDEIPVAISQSVDGRGRMAQRVKSMRSFAHPNMDTKVSVDINKALLDTITISRNEWKYDVEIVTDFDKSLPEVMCFAAEINQVFLNIIINAVHAIKDAKNAGNIETGEIAVYTRDMKEYAEIRITDNGIGIPEEIVSKIYDPFFTTKEVGRGTGQGLAISYSIIVDKHRGKIVCMSKVGVGTTFYIRLPYKPEDKDEEVF